MKVALAAGYWSSGPPAGAFEAVLEADRLGFDSIWTAEAYGSDAFTPLAWWGAHTKTVKLGTSIVQMAARTPAATAMHAITLDHLSGGRLMLGLGASGPQVVEGWYGQPYPRPLERTREFFDIFRAILRREGPVEYEGKHYHLPYPGGAGLGKALKSTVHPLRNEIPMLLAAEGPKNVALAAEIADGWIPFWFGPSQDAYYRRALAEGFGRAGARHSGLGDGFEVVSPLPIVPNDDVEAAADVIRPMLALYIGGMGAKGANFHFDVFARMGYEADCVRIQDLYLDGKKNEAIAAVPLKLVEDVALVGPIAKILDELPRWKETVITTAQISAPVEMLETVASILA